MTFLVVCLAAIAAVAAALCALADGALLALDENEPPSTALARALFDRREATHRALGFGRILSQLLAGAAAAAALKVSEIPPTQIAPLVIVVGVLVVVIAESAARTAGDALGPGAVEWMAPVIIAIENLLQPVVAFSSRGERVLHGLIPVPAADDEQREASIEQFRDVVTPEADPARDDRVLVAGVFSLGNTEVREIMVPRVEIIGVEKETAWSEVVDRVRSARHSRLVVFDGTLDEVLGLLYAKDLLSALVTDAEPHGGWLTAVRAATFIPATKTVEAQLRDFKATQRHIAIVVDEYGGTAGLVTLEDALELIVGDIRDEYDTGEPDVVRESDDRFWLSARVTLAELSELTGEDFIRDDVQTVGGLVYELLGHVPRNGETLTAGQFRVVVERVVRRKVERVYFERLAAAENAT